ncbi:MAG: hypothetical protein EOP86_25300, partial [Verrucomicrobiaceae bacterium]
MPVITRKRRRGAGLGWRGCPAVSESAMPAVILKSAAKALAQFLSDPRLWRILLVSAFVSLLTLGGLFAGVWWGVREGVDWIAVHWPKYAGWMKYTEGTFGFVTAAVVSFLLFPTVIGFVVSFFQEAVADAVEARYYPQLPKADGSPLLASLLAAVRFFVIMIIVNLLALPFYLVPGIGIALILAVNGLLAGREYYEVVALRRLTPAQMDISRRRNRLAYFLTGVGIAALALVPVV